MAIFSSTVPFATTISRGDRRTVTGAGGAAGVPGASAKVSAVAAEDTACPVHLTEPSGQYASGHDCTGTGAPSAACRASGTFLGSVPRAQGTPKAQPTEAAGLPSSQCRRTSPPAAAGVATGAVAAAATAGAAAVAAVAARADTPPRKTLLDRGNWGDCGDIVGLRISSSPPR